MKLETYNHSLEVKGLEFDCSAFGVATLAGFESLTIDGLVTLTYDEYKEFYSSKYAEIEDVLNQAAQRAADEWRENASELRRWLRASG